MELLNQSQESQKCEVEQVVAFGGLRRIYEHRNPTGDPSVNDWTELMADAQLTEHSFDDVA